MQNAEAQPAIHARRVTAFLEERGPERHNVIATAGPRARRYSKPRLRVDDLRALLADSESIPHRISHAEAALTRRIVARLLRIAAAVGETSPALRDGLLLAAGEAKYEHLYEPAHEPDETANDVVNTQHQTASASMLRKSIINTAATPAEECVAHLGRAAEPTEDLGLRAPAVVLFTFEGGTVTMPLRPDTSVIRFDGEPGTGRFELDELGVHIDPSSLWRIEILADNTLEDTGDPYGLDKPARAVPELVELFKRHRSTPAAASDTQG